MNRHGAGQSFIHSTRIFSSKVCTACVYSSSMVYRFMSPKSVHLFPTSQQLPSLGLRPMQCFLSQLSTLLGPSTSWQTEIQRYKGTIRCYIQNTKVPRHLQEQLMQPSIVCLLKTHFFIVFKIGGPPCPTRPPR